MTRASHASLVPLRTPTPRTAERQAEHNATLQLHACELRAARRALARGNPGPISHTARGLLTALSGTRLRVELAHAAAAFAEAHDERPQAREWVFFAVSARAALQQAAAHCPELHAELGELDESLEDAREAVLLLEPEDYREAVAGAVLDRRAWWGERGRLDAGLREVDLERVLGALGDD